MKMVIIGDNGHVVSKLVSNLNQLKHTVTTVSSEEDIMTLLNSNETTKDTDVIIDVTDSIQPSVIKLLGPENGVKHYIYLSVVGAANFPKSSYMQSKVAIENSIKASGLPYTILRATTFFEAAGSLVQLFTKGEEVHVSPAAFQPVASEEIAAALVNLALEAPLNGVIEMAGPVCMPMFEFVRYYLNEMEDWRHLVEDAHALYYDTELNDQSLVPGSDALLGKIKYEDWFLNQLVEE